MLDRSRCVILLAIVSLLITINASHANHADDKSIEPFTISFSPEQLSDLHTRLTNGVSRMSSSTLGGNKDWTYGTNPTYLTSLVNHWIHNYNWTARQERINHNLPQFTTVIDGLRLHFVHVRSSSFTAFPLLFSHGWPGSYLECEKILPLLTKADADLSFHVVCPSIPGYAFSSPPQQPGMDARGIAHIFHKLMLRLGYPTYYGQGGDWGSVILTQQAYLYPTHLLGLHINFLAVPPPLLRGWGSAIKTVMSLIVPSWFFSEKEVQMIRDTPFKAAQDFAYMAIQGTKPQTLGFALNDSPIGLASWLAEKYHAWTDLHDVQGDLNKVFSYDEMLDFIMIYWISGSISTSMRLYYEMFHSPHFLESARQLYVSVPVGVAEFKEIIEIPRSWAEYYYNIVHWNPQPRGGHFAALEQPTLLVNDLRQFIHTARHLTSAKDATKHEL